MGASVPTLASPGNHEAKDFNGQTYRMRLSQPNPGASYFSWISGKVFLVSTPAGAFFGYPMVYGMPTSGRAYTNSLGISSGADERFANATGYIQVIAGAGGQGMYDFTAVDTLEPTLAQQRKLPWLASSARVPSFVEYAVAGGEVAVTAYGYDDVEDTAPRVIDRFVLERKPYALDVPTSPRPILGDLPEAHGTLRYDVAEDCTTHEH
jgi:hypothetical protein